VVTPLRLAGLGGFALAVLLLSAVGDARAQLRLDGSGLKPIPLPISQIQAAELLLRAGHFEDANSVLLALEQTSPNDSQIGFLLGMVAVEQKDYRTAIHRFRRILAREPRVVRVRLELARAFFLAKDYDNAERQFRFARAGDVPRAVKTNIDSFLTAIRQLRRFTYNASLALAPDTNINAGPRIDTIDIYGLPFTLSDEARQQSGVGATANLGGELTPRLSRRVSLRIGAQLNSSTYPTHLFDDTTLSAYVGPKVIIGRLEVSPLMTAYRRWYGDAFYNQGYGPGLQVTYYPAAKFAVSATTNVQKVDYVVPGQSGNAFSAGVTAFYTLSPDSTPTLACQQRGRPRSNQPTPIPRSKCS
jgi:tetratricopeptide (TPR) repeat protein